MFRNCAGFLRFGMIAAVLVAVPLAGCSSSSLSGRSAFGNSQQQVAELPTSVNYTAQGALTEARGHFRNDDFGHSAAYYKKAVELAPNDPEGYVGLSASYDRLGRFDLSDRVYAALYNISGGTAQYFNNVGYSYMMRGDLRSALTNFRKASELDPDNIVVANNIQILSRAAAEAQA